MCAVFYILYFEVIYVEEYKNSEPTQIDTVELTIETNVISEKSSKEYSIVYKAEIVFSSYKLFMF